MSVKEKTYRVVKWLVRNLALTLLTAFVFLLGLELAYRYYWFDFYNTEITLLNEQVKNKKSSTTILVLGDSFTAGENSYVSILNDSLPDVRVINAAVPGFGIEEISTIAETRIDEFQPDAIILQLYAGNDLLDVQKPVNWSTVSFARNCYWSIANNFYSVRYLNYKLGQYKSGTSFSSESTDIKSLSEFSVATFSEREKMLIAADPGYLDKSINLSGGYETRYITFKKRLDEIVALCRERKIKLTLLVLPASCQVAPFYLGNAQQVGAQFANPVIGDTVYPLYTQLETDLAKDSVTLINPLGRFREMDSEDHRLFYANDIHLNAYGQLVLAKILLNRIAVLKS